MPDINIITDEPEAEVGDAKVCLRAVEREDIYLMQVWRNKVVDYCREWRPLSLEHQERWFKSLQDNDRVQMFSIDAMEMSNVVFQAQGQPDRRLGDVQLIGCGGFTDIDWRNRRAEISLYIGHHDYKKKGYGLAALQALLKFGFGTMGLYKVTAEVFEFNEVSLRLFERAGFERCGLLKAHHFHEGKCYDSVLMETFRP